MGSIVNDICINCGLPAMQGRKRGRAHPRKIQMNGAYHNPKFCELARRTKKLRLVKPVPKNTTKPKERVADSERVSDT